MRVLLLAGEPSGDRHAAGVARALRRLEPAIELRAMGSHALRDAGVDLVVDATELAVVGLTEVISRLGPLLAARRRLEAVIESWKPDVLVPVDYPDFNLRLAAWARRRGVPVAYFISPQVWAWRPGRVPAIGRAVSRMLVLFPFEVETYRAAGIPVEHVGHPLLDGPDARPSRAESRVRLGIASNARVVALLPGSRRKEVRATWPVLLDAARRLHERDARRTFLVPLAQGLDRGLFGDVGSLPVRFLPGVFADVVAAADVAAVASGTATLETALAGCPLVACYRMSRLTIALSRRLADPAFLARGLFALPNVVLGRKVVPELYQEAFTAEAVVREIERLEDPAVAAAMLSELEGLRAVLGGPGACERVARSVLQLAREGPG